MSINRENPSLSRFFEDEQRIITYLRQIACALDSEDSRQGAVTFLHQLAGYLACNDNPSLRLQVLPLPGLERPIRLFMHRAVFSPEYWGRTFAEGLLKKTEVFDGSKVVELGCGSGWVSILLLLRTRVREVLGLDLNEIAVTLARLNAWLNGTEPDGTLLLSGYGVPIVQAFRALTSDLLEQPLANGESFDHVIGCMPQVLHPDPSAAEREHGSRSDRDLYDLSNYCFQQGILEDRFGLPLIARALEQSQLCLNAGGKVTLILGGRPGPQAIESMFKRRGFEPTLIWSRRIQQADDTDLASLVALEKQHSIEFNFFLSRDSRLPVSASTAVSMLTLGAPIFHDLLVYQATTRWEKPTFGLLKNLHALELDSLRQELDFSRVSEEQISFSERLSAELITSRSIPYPHERSDLSLRQRLGKFLHVYCHWHAAPESLFIGPERAQLLDMVLSMVAGPGSRVLISHSLLPVYGKVMASRNLDLIVGNDDLVELFHLDDRLSPQVVLIAPEHLANPSPLLLNALAGQAFSHSERWYIVDDSDHFNIGSDLNSNAFLRLASREDLPGNLILLYGLIKNKVFPDLELSFLLNAPESWPHGLDVAAELSYSRIAWPTQLYYQWLFDELLQFAFPDNAPPAEKTASLQSPALLESFARNASDPVFQPKPAIPAGKSLIRLDYGEFEAPVPDLLVKGLVKAFLEPPVQGLETLMTERVCAYMKSTRDVELASDRVVVGQGVYPLLGGLVRLMAKRLGRQPLVAIPDGTYGPSYALVEYHGGQVRRLPTEPRRAFKFMAQAISELDFQPDLLWLTQPNNPSGLYYHEAEVDALFNECARRNIAILADEIFFLLSDIKQAACTPPTMSFGKFLNDKRRDLVFLSDGVSKAFAAGGLRCGFMITPNESWARQLKEITWLPPQSTLRAWDELYSAFLDEAPHQLMDVSKEREKILQYLAHARARLCRQREAVLELLKKYDLDDGLPDAIRGGLFVLAKMAEDYQPLAGECAVLINSDDWARTPGWSRICFSIAEQKLDQALLRLSEYLDSKYARR